MSIAQFVLESAEGTLRVLSGYQYQEPPADAKRFSAGRPSGGLPPKVDLREWMTTVEDQGQTNTCTANATAGAYEYLMKRHLGDDAYDVSRMFIYYNARTQSGGEIADEGAVLVDVIEGLRQHGACAEDSWPFELDTVNDEPHADAYTEAESFLVEDVQLVPTDLDEWRGALAEGYPIIFGISLYDSFYKQRRPGLVPMPTQQESQLERHGGHAMLCVGYSDADEVFIVRNSWGAEWGDQGYCYMPYGYLMDPRQNDGDSWIIRQVEVVDEEAGWGDEESVLTEVGTFLAEMDEDAYGELVDAMGEVAFERRIALLFVAVAAADGEVDDAELAQAALLLQPVLDSLSSSMSPEKLLRKAQALFDGDDAEDLIGETIVLFAEHVPADVLASLLGQLREVVEAGDGEDEDETEVLDAIVVAWQVEEFVSDEAEVEGEEEGEESDESEEDEESDEEDADESEDEESEDEESEEEESEEEDSEDDEGYEEEEESEDDEEYEEEEEQR
ncbi:C1 family peptidase [Pseudonocardia broussonetiae]|uniref:Peptidase C1A papain C-terminal domain-containing protein n=1 Tax=Pseudonocardia broussonetiae TaxID=2736640 RepID=A0A6M6JK99_9PSEU|nr:C1 family peptidase [Pseudonocardia broussonetiae]QJY47470.1 hypothetical protein HOP40_18000 [Pseudonocardia broussonetiae]